MYKRLTFFCIHFVFWFLFRCDINFKLKAVNQRNPYWIMSHRGFLKLGMSQKPLKGRHLLLKRSFHVFCLGTVTTPLICTQQLVQATGSPLANTHIHTHTHTWQNFLKKATHKPNILVRWFSLVGICVIIFSLYFSFLIFWQLACITFVKRKHSFKIIDITEVCTAAAATAAKSLQSCLTLCDPIDGSPPGSPVPGILQQEQWSGLPFPSPMHESEKWKGSRSVVSDS